MLFSELSITSCGIVIMLFLTFRQTLQSEIGIVGSASMLFNDLQGYLVPNPSRIQRINARTMLPTNSRTLPIPIVTQNHGYVSFLLENRLLISSTRQEVIALLQLLKCSPFINKLPTRLINGMDIRQEHCPSLQLR